MQDIVDGTAVGNLYINRNQIGAIVGSQPFGGEGLSGTGPKAGGPHYVARFRRPKDAAPLGAGAGSASLPIEALSEELGALSPGKWAARHDRISVLRAALRGKAAAAMAAAAALDEGPIDLPGPTGESNRLSLAPKGRVLCLGPSAEAVLDQAVQALRCGNAVLAVAPGATAALAPLIEAGLPVAALDGGVAPEALSSLAIDALAIQGDGSRYRPALAAREGPIIPLITAPIAPAAYAHERAVCIDTTAAGGNASLLAAAG